MAIEHRETAWGGGRKDVVMTECPKCGAELPDGTGFADHWVNECSANPEADADAE